ncbi:unnamed protein product, partial [Urochloa humidicola]
SPPPSAAAGLGYGEHGEHPRLRRARWSPPPSAAAGLGYGEHGEHPRQAEVHGKHPRFDLLRCERIHADDVQTTVCQSRAYSLDLVGLLTERFPPSASLHANL